MVAVNAAPAAAVLLTDSTNTTAAAHFLITPTTSSRADMSSVGHDSKKTTINVNTGLLLYHHQCSYYSQKVGRVCEFVSIVFSGWL